MQGKEYNQHKRKQTLPERMFATTGASQARCPMTMGALAPWDANCRRQTQRFAAVMFVFVFLASGVYFLHPFSIDNSYAETATSSASAEMSVNLDPTITIWTTDTSNNPITAANIAASPDESVATTAVRTHVSTNNLTGYTLTIQSNSTDAKMKHENTSVTKTIDPLTGSGTSSSSWAGDSSLNNMWGYSIGTNDSFVGVPGSSSTATTIDSTDAPNNDNYTDITFATKADLSLPAGTYTDTVIFSAVANALPVEYMQDADASWCASLDIYNPANSEATTYTLTDSRDGNTYQVRKLTDGNCWMVQNLRLIDKTVTPTNSNVFSEFTVPASTPKTDWENIANIDNAKAYAYAYGTGNADYGVHYNWYTATAGSGTSSMTSGDASASICPKGWHLPTGNIGGEWYNALVAVFGQNAVDNKTMEYGQYDNALTSDGGYWWSSTVSGSYVYRVEVDPADDDLDLDQVSKYAGINVRCMLSS